MDKKGDKMDTLFKWAVYSRNGRLVAGTQARTKSLAKLEACWLLGFDPITLFVECGYQVRKILPE